MKIEITAKVIQNPETTNSNRLWLVVVEAELVGDSTHGCEYGFPNEKAALNGRIDLIRDTFNTLILNSDELNHGFQRID